MRPPTALVAASATGGADARNEIERIQEIPVATIILLFISGPFENITDL
jgi:hypothetical protein